MFIGWISQASAQSYLPLKASTLAGGIDNIFNFMVAVSIFFFIILMGGMAFFIVKYKRKSDNDKTAYITHNHTLEFLWSFIPLVLLLGVGIWGYIVWDKARTFPKDSVEVNVVGKQWLWEISYANGKKVVNDLVVPKDTPIILNMTSADVIHSFYVPSFRIKQDVVPGKRSKLWFEATREGDFRVFCAEFCGTAHSNMIGYVKVLPKDEFKEWLDVDASAGKSLAELGATLYNSKGCFACHSVDGTNKVGPSFKGLWGRKSKMADGSSVDVNENYIQESLMKPQAKIVAGYPPTMPTFQGQLTEEEVTQIIEYFKTLK